MELSTIDAFQVYYRKNQQSKGREDKVFNHSYIYYLYNMQVSEIKEMYQIPRINMVITLRRLLFITAYSQDWLLLCIVKIASKICTAVYS